MLPTHLPPPSCTHAQSCNPMDFSRPDSSVHGLFQARILEWVAISFSRWCRQFLKSFWICYNIASGSCFVFFGQEACGNLAPWLGTEPWIHILYIGRWGLFFFFFFSWRLITLQYCSGFCHTLTWVSHGFTCIPHLDPPSHLPLYLIPLGLPSAPGLSTCLMHPTWAGDLFHPR